MKSSKSVSFDEQSLKIIQKYQRDNGVWIFSTAVNKIIQSYKNEEELKFKLEVQT